LSIFDGTTGPEEIGYAAHAEEAEIKDDASNATCDECAAKRKTFILLKGAKPAEEN
jgi:rubredoxin